MNEMNWDDLRLFLAVARAGGLAGASGATGVSRPTLGRRMLTLEAALGAELFVREARGYRLTQAGQRLVQRAEAAEEALAPIAAGQPLVKISAGAWVTWLLCRNAPRLMVADVQLRFIAADHHSDIARREAVIGVRNRRPHQVGLAAQQLREVRFAIYGDGPWAAVQGPTPSAAWVATQAGARIEVTGARSALDLVQAGVARAVLPCFVGEVLGLEGQGVDALTHEQWLVSHAEARHDAPVRRVLRQVRAVLMA